MMFVGNITIDQSEASLQVKWSLSTNQRPVCRWWITLDQSKASIQVTWSLATNQRLERSEWKLVQVGIENQPRQPGGQPRTGKIAQLIEIKISILTFPVWGGSMARSGVPWNTERERGGIYWAYMTSRAGKVSVAPLRSERESRRCIKERAK